MKSDNGATISAWAESRALAASHPLGEDLRVDVCVVGAGIAGLSTAYMLARAGKRVVVLEDGVPGGGETCRTTAHLACALDDRFQDLEDTHGTANLRIAAESHAAAIDRIESIITQEKIHCEFERVDGFLFARPGEDEGFLGRELEAARRAGVDVEMVPRAPLASFDTGPALRFARQGQFHPLKYIAGLARAFKSDGGEIYTRTHVTEVASETPARVRTERGPVVTADAVVVATNTPINDRVTMHTKQAAYRSYVITARVPAGSVTRALYWDTEDPYHYVRLRPADEGEDGLDLLIVGGEDHKTGEANDADDRWARLESWARARFPRMGGVEQRWSGQVMEPVDGLAYIGPNPGDLPHIYVATGDSGMGMTHGTIAGMLLSDMITGRENAWAQLYDPSRIRARSAFEWLKENIDTALRYGRWLTPGDVSSAEDVARGHGAVIRRGLTKVAVYRDLAGRLHEYSAVCPHLGCVVAWNGAERTFDCPAHGSRFDTAGQVVNGPANCGLTPLEAPDTAGEPAPGGRRR